MGERFENIISESDVPDAARSMILRIVRRTRLRKREKVTVARELVERFTTGLREGTPEPELIAQFGDEKQQARKIRRSMKRRRGIMWHAWVWWWRAVSCACLLVLAVFLFYGFRVWFAVPNVCRDFRAELFESSPPPESDRAWPLVEEATRLLTATPRTRDENQRSLVVNVGVIPEDSEHWEAVVRYVRSNARSLELAHAAGRKPVDGFIPNKDSEPSEGLVEPQEQIPPLGRVKDQAAFSIHNLVRLLCANIRVAASENDPSCAFDSARGAIGLVRGLEPKHSAGTLVWNYASIRMIAETVVQAVARRPALWADEQLALLSAELMTLERDRLKPDPSRVRAEFLDHLQRVYTDNGKGGGLYIGENLPSEIKKVLQYIRADRLFGRPLTALFVHDRREQERTFDALRPWIASFFDAPPWSRRSIGYVEWQVVDRLGGYGWCGRYLPTLDHVMNDHFAYGPLDCALMTRDAAVTVIALERFRRQHLRYPESLNELVPGVMPALLTDIYTGESLHYALVDQQPLLYSIGVDYDDDGGTSSTPPSSRYALMIDGWSSRGTIEDRKRYNPERVPDGDWVLYPPSPAQ